MNARCPRSLSLTLAFVSSLALAGSPATAAEPHYYGNLPWFGPSVRI
jgi:hypothetical protein